MKRDYSLFVQDIADAIQHIKQFVGSMKQKEFLGDEKTRSAVAFKIENIGEASKSIPKSVRNHYKEIPWADMARMRDKITHFYFGIDFRIVWQVAKKDIPQIEPLIAEMLADLKKPTPKS